MQFVRLKLEHFAGVASCDIEFGPGLNVLYGPNELGKSTIVAAIRAALLVQSTSKSHEPWVRWNTDEPPQVELAFQTEPQRIWRVKKSFSGGRGKATLDESKDGVNFSNVAKGRHVDGEVRKLLNWGIPEPGGKAGKVKGIPETFLTAVLLPQQDAVTDVFRRHLGEDYDESGKQMLTDALQALAADPMFVDVLAKSQKRVDEAFTSKGKKKSGKFSPWKKISDEIKQAQERVVESKEEEETSEAVRLGIKKLHDELVERTEACESARANLAEREENFRTSEKLTAELAVAEQELQRVQKIHDDYSSLASKEAELRKHVDELDRQCEELTKAVSDAVTDLKVAQEAMDAATSEQTVAQRRIKQQELENELLQLQAAETRTKEELSTAEQLRDRCHEVQSLETIIKKDTERLEQQRHQVQELDAGLKALVGLEILQAKQEALSRLKEAEEASKFIAELREDNAENLQELQKLEEELQVTKLPGRDQLSEMKKLQQNLRVAEARLDVGLSVKITPLKDLDVTATADENPPSKHKLDSESETLEAERLLELKIGDVAEIVIRGGKPDARKVVDDLLSRWQEEVQPVLQAAEVETLDKLEEARNATDEAKQRAGDLASEIQWNESQIEQKTPLADEVTSLKEDIERANQQLEGFDSSAFAAQMTVLESRPKEDRIAAIREWQDEKKITLAELKLKIAGDAPLLETKQAQLETKQNEIKQAEVGLNGTWVQVMETVQSTLDHHAEQRASLETQLKALGDEGGAELTKLQERLDTAKQQREESLHTQQELATERTQSLEALNKCSGELTGRKEAFASVNLEQAQNKVKQLKESVAELSEGAELLTAEALAMQQEQVGQMKAAIEQIQAKILNEEGALRHVGGDIARERHESFADALQQKHNEETEMALDYDAWRLLLETLREVENDEAAHLGQAIMEPIAQRFGELTGNRYGKMHLGPSLETQGIVAQGESRDVNRLSVGTREQLSTVLRLSLAEQLGSALVLDDQLAQSDLKRLEWFRDTFRASAAETQIIVLTCRPGDYLLDSELVAEKDYLDSPDGLVRAVNLELLVSNESAAD